MSIITLGINHKTAPVDIREQVAFAPSQHYEALSSLIEQTPYHEAVILSTCNRTELYCSGPDENQPKNLLHWLANFHQLSSRHLQEHHYHYTNNEAIQHLMRVASGLDSLVLGEPQILGQLKQAYQSAKRSGTIDGLFERLFQQTFFTAKAVRNQTEIGHSAVSVAYSAVRLAEQIFGQLKELKILLIGAGETIELVSKHLVQQECQQMVIANRTLQKAQELAEQLSGKAINLAQIPDYLSQVDVVISSTASTLPIIGKGSVEQALKERRFRPILFIDLAVPRDIESQVAELPDAFLYTVDDLQSIVENNMASREKEAIKAEQIIQQHVVEFNEKIRHLQLAEPIKLYRQKCSSIRDDLLQKALADLSRGKASEQIITELANKLTNRLIHSPTQVIKTTAATGDTEQLNLLKNILGITE